MTMLASMQTAPADPLMAVACPGCHAALSAESAAAGTPARCPLCQAAFAHPAPRQQRPQADVSQPASERDGDPLRRLREERSTRRGRRNLVMLVSGVVILLAIVLLFGTRRPKKRR
jgi:hypothetical protein